ncbi:MAG: transcriptional regulator, TraR/DksA family protein [Desulfamplus sp.]|nr:transcriptional regulator, TraR/DksA family protein [Desulfamplus sp.]MBF0390183.1 transcriptional regulator, TraR/DksA family protein [Desulfamplus sp.]
MKNSSQMDYVQTIDYTPSEDEEYLNEQQLRYFEYKLFRQKRELEEKIQISIAKLKSLKAESSDLIDKSNNEYEIELELKAVERNANLLSLSENALNRLKEGGFGYCIITGQAIGVKRLNIIPTTTMSVDAMRMFEQDRYERYNSH